MPCFDDLWWGEATLWRGGASLWKGREAGYFDGEAFFEEVVLETKQDIYKFPYRVRL